jgi:hypothetical protein
VDKCIVSLLTPFLYKESLDARKPPGSGYTSKVRVRDRYHIVGFISSGTYGRVYKAIGKNGQKGEFAIKKLASHPGILTSSHDSPAVGSSRTKKAK